MYDLTKTGRSRLLWPLVMMWLAISAAHAMPTIAPGHDRPQLGVVVQQVPFPVLQELGIPYGVSVRSVVPDSPADEAGVHDGDILVYLGKSPVYSPSRLQWLVGRMPTDKPLELQLNRNGESVTLQVSLRAPQPPVEQTADQGPGIARLGIGMTTLTSGLRQKYGVPPATGVLVTDVEEGGPASAAGLQPGDVLVRIDRRSIHNPGDVLRAVHFFDPGDVVKIAVLRDGKNAVMEVTLGRADMPDHPGMFRGPGPWSGFPMPSQRFGQWFQDMPSHRFHHGWPYLDDEPGDDDDEPPTTPGNRAAQPQGQGI